MNKSKNEQLYYSTCPVCGHTQIKGKPRSSLIYRCPKCKQPLELIFDNGSVRIQLLSKDDEPVKPPVSD